MSKKNNLFISLMILFVGISVGFQILTRETLHAATEDAENAVDPPTPRGPHNGRLFTDKDLTIEVKIHETGIPPEFHIYFYHQNTPVPFSEVDLTAKVVRLGQTDAITFKQEKDYGLSEQVIYEPHSFDVIFEGIYQEKKYTWRFTQQEGRIEVAPDLLKRSEINILKAGSRSIGKHNMFPGQITMDQDKYVHIVPAVEGRAIEVYKHVGERVARGELLAVLNSRELSDLRLEQQLTAQDLERTRTLYQRESRLSQNTRKLLSLLQKGNDPESIHQKMMKTPVGENKSLLLSAFAELRLERQKFNRETQMQKDQISSEESVQNAHTAYDKALSHYSAALEEVVLQREQQLIIKQQDMQGAQAEHSALIQKLQVLQVPTGGKGLASARYEVRSPISGVLTEKHLAIGEVARGDKPSFVVANLAVVWVEIQIPDTQLEQIQENQKVTVISQEGTKKAIGRIAHINPAIDTLSRRAEAEVHIDNPEGFWKPGMFVNVEVTTQEKTVAVAVAKSALQSYNDWTVVYGKFGDTFEIRPLELGREDEEWVEVKAGLKAGQAYAASNSFILKAELGKTAATHDH